MTHPTPKRGPKKPGRHQWHVVRGEKRKRRTQASHWGLGARRGDQICLRRGCNAQRKLVRDVTGYQVVWRTQGRETCPS